MNSIKPGLEWLDTNGCPIQAHAGQLFIEDGVYYWYGEDKSNMTVDVYGETYHNGVRCYSSTDLYNWKDEGTILAPSDDENSPLHSYRVVDRPHIIYNEKTKKYVMWIKFAGEKENLRNWKNQRAGVLVADKLLGPYTLVKDFLPNGMHMGDFDFVKDGDKMFISVTLSTIRLTLLVCS